MIKKPAIRTLWTMGAMVLLLCGCQSPNFTLSGHFDPCPTHQVYLDEILPDGIRTLDTLLIVNGDFSYRMEHEEAGLFRLRFSDTNFLTFSGKGNDRLVFSGNAEDLPHTYSVRGNISSDILWKANCRINEMYALTDSLSRLFVQAKNGEEIQKISQTLDSCYNARFQICKNHLEALIRNHPEDIAVLPVFYQRVGTRPFFSEKEDTALFQEMVKNLTESMPENPHVKYLQERVCYE